MRDIPCPHCARLLSPAAEACPQCGHPLQRRAEASGPKCYACSALATTLCQRCGTPSCIRHLGPVENRFTHELCCAGCYEISTQHTNREWIAVGVIVSIAAVVILGLSTISCINRVRTEQKTFHRNDTAWQTRSPGLR